MKRLFLLFGVTALCLWIVCSCQKTNVSEHYYDLIPADNRGVYAININQLIKKGEITEPMQEHLLAALGLQEILKNVGESGIDFSDYVFIVIDSVGGNAAVVAKVKDLAKLKNMFVNAEKQGACTPLVTHGEYESVISGNTVCRFNSSVLYCTMSYNLERAREYATRIAEKKERSITDDPCFRKIRESKNDMELLFSMKNLPESLQNSIMTHIANPDFDLTRMSVNGSLNFENGKISLQYTLMASEPAVMQAFLEQGNYIEKVSEHFLTYYPASTLLCALYNCRGDQVNKLLDKIDFWQNLPIAEPETVKKVLASLDGDMAYGITGLSAIGMPNVLVYARVKDTYLADLVAEMLKKHMGNLGALKEKGGHRYEFGTQMMDFYFGVKDGNLFYLTNEPEAYRNLGKTVQNPWNKTVMASGIKESYGGLVLNIEELLRAPIISLMLQQTLGSHHQAGLIQKALSEFSYMELLTLAPNHAVWNIYLKNKNRNSLKTLIETGKELAEIK